MFGSGVDGHFDECPERGCIRVVVFGDELVVSVHGKQVLGKVVGTDASEFGLFEDFAGVHVSVGLSNLTVMLPPKRADGSPLKGPLESAFLTKAMPLGLDMIVGSVKRKYQLLPADHPAMICLDDVLEAEGFDAIMRIREFYS